MLLSIPQIGELREIHVARCCAKSMLREIQVLTNKLTHSLFIIASNTSDIRIEVGYDLEPVITDGRAGRILDNEVMPYLKRGDFDKGLEAGVLAIESYVRDGSPPSIAEENPVQGVLSGFKLPLYTFVILGIISMYVLGFMARSRSIWLWGIWGIIVGLVLGFGFGGVAWIVLLPLGLGFIGLLFDIVLSSNYRGRSTSGQSTGWFPSGGGFRGAGGGFGGFGGGRSGGGGAQQEMVMPIGMNFGRHPCAALQMSIMVY